MNDYFKRIHTLQKTAPLSVYTGVECGMQLITDVVDKNKALCRDKEFDYIIGSLHLVDGKDPYLSLILGKSRTSRVHSNVF